MDGFLNLDSRIECDDSGKQITLGKLLRQWYQPFTMNKKRIDSFGPLPLTFQWFESVLSKIVIDLQDRFFGYTYHVLTDKRLKRDTSNKSLVKSLCDFEKYCEEHKNRFVTPTNPYEFLKLVLEEDAPLFGFEEELFGPIGIKRDRSGLSIPQKNVIAAQAAAQVLWYLEKDNIPNTATMAKLLLDKKNSYYELLELDRFNDPGTIKCWIREVCPIPKGSRRGRPSKKQKPNSHFHALVDISGIFQENGKTINFLKLRFAVVCLTKILKVRRHSIQQVKESNLFQFYQTRLPSYFHICLNDWADDAFVKNGGIFDS